MPHPPRARVVIHPDVLRLESELIRTVAEVRDATAGIPSILVIAPSARQVTRLRERLAEAFGGLAGVEVVHFEGLARGRVPDARVASTPVLEALVAQLLTREPELAGYAEDRPAVAAAIARLLVELREAGITPADLKAIRIGRWTPVVARLLAAYEERVGVDGWTDRPGLQIAARERVRSLPPRDAVLVYGAYDLLGVHIDLVRALPTRRPVDWFVPVDAEAPAWTYGREYLARHLGPDPEVAEDPEPRPFLRAARAIGRPDAPEDLDGLDLHFAHAPGPEAELTWVARQVLDLLQSDVKPHEIGILARTLDGYLTSAEAVFERHGLPIDASAARPLDRYPLPRTLLQLLRVLAGDFERWRVMELVRSPHLSRAGAGLEDDERWWPGAWDEWSRSLGLTRGLTVWTRDWVHLVGNPARPPWIEEGSTEHRELLERARDRAASAQVLADLVGAWGQELDAWKSCRTAAEHASFLSGLAARWIRGWEETDPAVAEIRRATETAFQHLEGLDWARGAAGPGGASLDLFAGAGDLDPAAVLGFLEGAMAQTPVPWSHENGVAFLDAMQARGLVFRHVFLVGLNEAVFPRVVREDPFLPDPVRDRLRRETGKPLSVREDGRQEELLLLAATLAATTGPLSVSWQRTDTKGKVTSPSPYLRELARLLPGAPPVSRLVGAEGAAVSIPTHPGQMATRLAGKTGMLSREEAALVLAEQAGPKASAVLAPFLGRHDPGVVPDLEPGLRMIGVTETIDGPLDYDARVPGGIGGERPFSPTSLKRLGSCPQTFFFRYVLGVRPMSDQAEEFRFEARELGNHMHRVLELVFRDLDEADRMGPDADPDALVAAGQERLEHHWNTILEPVAERIGKRYPFLFAHADQTWKTEILSFLDRNLRRLAAAGHRVAFLESPWAGVIEIPAETLARLAPHFGETLPDRLEVRGVPDRVTRGPEGNWLISDYKTSGKIAKEVEAKRYLGVERLQVPLYALLAETQGAEAAIEAELLGIGPVFLNADGTTDEPVALDMDKFEKHREGFTESLAVLAATAATGRFPFFSGFHCQWCDFRVACRRHHFPTEERVLASPDHRPYFLTKHKSTRALRIDDVTWGEDTE